MYFARKTLLSASAVAAATNSEVMECLQTTKLTIGCSFTVTTGSYSLQAQESPDYDPAHPELATWFDVGSAIAVTATGKGATRLTDTACQYYRVVVSKTSGTIDTLLITANAKGV